MNMLLAGLDSLTAYAFALLPCSRLLFHISPPSFSVICGSFCALFFLYQRIDGVDTGAFSFPTALLSFFLLFSFLLESMGAGVIVQRCKDGWRGRNSLICMWNWRAIHFRNSIRRGDE